MVLNEDYHQVERQDRVKPRKSKELISYTGKLSLLKRGGGNIISSYIEENEISLEIGRLIDLFGLVGEAQMLVEVELGKLREVVHHKLH
jgi:hypothetical protein